MQASSFLASRLRLLLLVILAGPAAQAQTANPTSGNLATQHGSGGTTKPVTPPQAAPRPPVHPAPVIQPHGLTHALKPGALKPGGVKLGAQKPAAKGAPPPVVAAPVPVPEPATPAAPAEPAKGSATGNPLPRFAALRTDEVNLRRGPGTRYPIDWVYKRRDLPVEIEREFEVWRLITDPDGTKGWVHQATLTGRRSFIVTGAERVLHHDPSDTSVPVARLKPGVIGHIRACDAGSDWCQMQVGEYRGYLKRSEFWGALPNEAISN